MRSLALPGLTGYAPVFIADGALLLFEGVHFADIDLPEGGEELRREVREFLDRQLSGEFLRNSDFNSGESPEFSRKLGARGWIGMTWPRQYGGHERSFLERYIVTEELLAAGAPVSAHWIADRQSGPLLLRFGNEAQKQEFLPAITRGESYFSIGMSEPDSGSDLASIRTSATRGRDGWLLNGSKVWTTGAHLNHFMITLVRTSPAGDNRHAGMSQFIVDLHDPGVLVTPIIDLAGQHSFNQVLFDDVLIPDDRVVGELGNGWQQVMSELDYERSGPERFLSAFRVMVEFVRAVGPAPDTRQAEVIGRLAAHMMTLRQMSLSVAGMLQAGSSPNVEASLVKDLGTNFEKEVPEILRLAIPPGASQRFIDTIDQCLLHAPAFTLRGGTREILRGVIARGLGLR
jgi:acyl-CoA dehydrogenase